MNLLRLVIRRFDGWLSRQYHVEEFTDDPQCIMRIQAGRTAHGLSLPEGAVPPGSEVLFLHMWNERAPLIPADGPTLDWALATRRKMIHSLRLVARHLQAAPSLKGVQAIGGVTAHLTLKEADGGRAMLEHLGFAVIPYHRPAGAFGEFWENFYTWWLMWTFNPVSVRHRSLFRLQRSEFWMSAQKFLEKFGKT